jgi:uncharacterized protein (DUF302 family)
MEGDLYEAPHDEAYGYSIGVADGYDEAVIRARLALRSEGFSILTEMHVGEVLGAASGQRQYLIMGSWSSGITRSAPGGPEVAIHLPCNLVILENGDGAIVSALDPSDEVDPSDPDAADAAKTAREALSRALQRMSTSLEG